MEQTSVLRASLVVALGALLEAVLSPYLTFGPVSPKFTLLAIVYAVYPLGDLQAVLIGFFGGVLYDALGGGIFGVGAMGGLIAALLAARAGAVRRKGMEGILMAQAAALSVAAYDIIDVVARGLAGLYAPPLGGYLFTGVLPDTLLNGALAYTLAAWMSWRVRKRKGRSWEAER
ncbi:MAG: rod shape-determining protein MreD [Rubrobacter sp.]|nr:rod shape-determining protein MreD [Rubrobacter sp.]